MCGRWPYTPTFRGYSSFFGYYSGSQDYYTHRDSGFDLHYDVGENCGENCSVPALAVSGNYSTELYADHAVQLISDHVQPRAGNPGTNPAPLFIYQAFQSVHEPIEAPAHYVTPYAHLDPNRQMFAGMVAALDLAIGRVVTAWQAAELWDDTLTIFSTDNGGPVGSKNGHPTGIGGATGSQNWPLRGGKGAYFQGGVRGTAWIHGAGETLEN